MNADKVIFSPALADAVGQAAMLTQTRNLAPDGLGQAMQYVALLQPCDGQKHVQAASGASTSTEVLAPAISDTGTQGNVNGPRQAQGVNVEHRQLTAAADTSNRVVLPFAAPALPTCDARDGTADSRPLTEFGNAQRLFDVHGERLRYVPETKAWLVWQGGAWCWDDGAGVRSLAATLPADIYAEGSKHLSDGEHFATWARKSQGQRVVTATVAMLADFPSIRLRLACIDAEPLCAGFAHAQQVIDLRSGATRAAKPGDYVTKTLGVDTLGEAAKAVCWAQFLGQVFEGDQELIGWVQRFCGYVLTGATQEQFLVFCYGGGANGKTVFIELLKYVLGDYGRAIAPETLAQSKRQAGGATPDLVALIGARLVLCNETEGNAALAESLVKSLVSGDSMMVRPLYGAPLPFKPTFKLLMAGNHRPIVRGSDDGIWRRIRLLPFPRSFAAEERDPYLLGKLKAEAPHILAWMLEGCLAWQRQGLADTPRTIGVATAAYREEQDIMGCWLTECTRPALQGEASTGDLYASYVQWCLDNGQRPESQVELGRRLSERGYIKRKSGGKRLWGGLVLTAGRPGINAHLRAVAGQ